MAEEALSIVDAPADTNVEVSRASSRAKSRMWMAEKWNRQDYGQDKGVTLNISTGSLHLDALRAFPAKVTGSAQELPNTATVLPALPSSTSTSDDAA